MNVSFFNNVQNSNIDLNLLQFQDRILREPSNEYTIAYARLLLESTQMYYRCYMNFILSMSRQNSSFSIRKYILNMYAIKAGYDKKINVHFLTQKTKIK